MGKLFAQIAAVIYMNIKSLPQRFWASLTTLLAVGIVVTVLLAFLAMGEGFRQTLQSSGSDSVAVILKAGSQTELNSGLGGDDVKNISNAPGIAHDGNGPITSGELYVIVDGIKKSSQTEVNLPLRGISLAGFKMREKISITAGRMFEPGKNEIVVGNSVLQEFSGFELGSQIGLGGTMWTVVGVFDAGGSVFGSELWADTRTIQAQFNRGNSYQSVRVQLETPGDVKPIQDFIEQDPRLVMDIVTEKDYFAEQSRGMSDLIFYLGWPLAILMAFGALAGALNTMYTSVESKAVEIATLRAIGFKGTAAFIGTLVESVVLAFIGGIVGVLAAFLLFDGISTSTMSGSFTQVVFDFNVSGDAFKNGIILAVIIGFVGGIFPAWRASRMPLLVAFTAGK